VDLYSTCREHTSKALRYGTRSQGISVLPAHFARAYPLTELTIPAFAFPASLHVSFRMLTKLQLSMLFCIVKIVGGAVAQR